MSSTMTEQANNMINDITNDKATASVVQDIIKSFISNGSNTTTSNGNDDDRVEMGDDFIHITLKPKHKRSDSNVSMNDAETSAALAEATAELAAASIVPQATPPPTSESEASPTTGTSGSSMDESKDNESLPSEEEATEEDTSHDEASLASISKVGESVDRKLYELERVTKRLADHIVRLVGLAWRVRAATSTQTNEATSLLQSVRAAKSMSAKMEYEAGVSSEWLFSQLMTLDNIRGSSKVKAARKAMVARLKSSISSADNVRARAKRAALAFHSIIDRHVAKLPASSSAPSSPSATSATPPTEPTPTATPATPSTSEDTKREQKAAPSSSVSTKAAAAAETVVNRDESLRWSPEFVSRELLDGVILTSKVPGVTSQSIKVNVDEDKRLLLVSGTRTLKKRVIDQEATKALQQQYDSIRHPNDDDEDEEMDYGFGGFFGFGRPRHQRRRRVQVEPVTKVIESAQWFDEKLQLPTWLSVDVSKYRTSLDESSGMLSISIPKVTPPKPKPSAAQQARAAAQRHQQEQQQAAAAARRQQQAAYHPFLGGGYPGHGHGGYGYDDHEDEESEEYVTPPPRRSRPAQYYQPQYAYPSSYGHPGYGRSPFGFGW
jgi:HSP20 family molecular chaperone IbpA